jgi:hypothetical protein
MRCDDKPKHVRASRPAAVMRPLDPADPRSLVHPGQRERWLNLARTLGEGLAQLEWNRRHGGGVNEQGDEGKDRGDLCPVLE